MPRGKNRKVTVGLVKVLAEWGEPDRNLELLQQATAGLASARLDVLVTPECYLDAYMIREKKWTRAKLRACSVSGPDDPRVQRAVGIARPLGCYLVLGATERDRRSAFRNVAYLMDRRGAHVGTYRKVMSTPPYRPGNELPVFRTDFARIGIVICADRRWPEHMRVLRLGGAEMILNPSWGWYGEGNTAIMRTRAYENGVPVCFVHPRQALVCLPDGNVGAVLESNLPGVLVHELDLKDNVPARRTADKAGSHPVQNRRPGLYGPIAER
jgi:predicted amidohydrolase